MNLSNHFTFDEMTATSHTKYQVENKREGEKPETLVKLTRLCCEVLEPLRKAWGGPIKVNSGFRCKNLNTAIKGSSTSQHMFGEAADITIGDPDSNKQLWDLARKLAKDGTIVFGQLILEVPPGSSWIHISSPTDTLKNEVLIFDGKKYTKVK